MLESRFAEPAGWQWQARFETRDGQYVRGGWVIPPNPRALVVVLGGLSEYIEKYFETFHDLLARGFAVAAMDWRGQGLSWRHDADPRKRMSDDFDLDRCDIQAFLATIPLSLSVPRVMLAHSMGAHIGLRVLKTLSGHFQCAVMTAPMFGINLPGPVDPLLQLYVRVVSKCGMRKYPLPGGKEWTETAFNNNMKQLTSDPERTAMQFYWMTARPELRMGTLTYSWLEQALKSIRLVACPEWLGSIQTPCLVFQSGQEKIVSNRAMEKCVPYLKQGQLLKIPDALHEVIMERDVYRNQFWSAFDGFVANYV